MTQKLVIRDEKKEDISAISEVTIAAFADMEISSHTEQFIIKALRSANVLTVSLVAEIDNEIIGHIAFSPITISDETQNWYGLGPVSIVPKYQRHGYGKALIKEGLSQLEKLNAEGCCLIGHPQYYKQFGFENTNDLVYEGVPHEVFFALSFNGSSPQGKVTFHEGFTAKS